MKSLMTAEIGDLKAWQRSVFYQHQVLLTSSFHSARNAVVRLEAKPDVSRETRLYIDYDELTSKAKLLAGSEVDQQEGLCMFLVDSLCHGEARTH